MFIRRVTAHAFGPLVGQTLEFADGMTVVYGPNESAKSTWHAAAYAALCGRRRGKGGGSRQERLFADRHRPWDRDEWIVSTEIELDDSRRVELRQDLDGKVDCHAKDLDLGTDYSAEISNDGMPDAARWLGLDRHSFAATACIAQAKMLAVLEGAGGLQDHLQRAAATAGTDTTAAAALERIGEFQRNEVGADRVNGVKPLRRAIVAQQQAAEDLATARTRRTEYERLLVEVDSLRAEADRLARHLRLHEAMVIRAAADRLTTRATEATELDALVGGVEPTLEVDEANAQQVAAALAGWRARPLVNRASDPDLDQPGAAGGPGSADRTDGPGLIAGADLAGPSDQEMWDLAQQLELTGPTPDPDLSERVAAASARVATREHARSRGPWLTATGLALALTAAVLVAFSSVPLAGLCFVAGALLIVAGLVFGRSRGLEQARTELAEAKLAEASAQWARHDVLAQRREAENRCAQLGLPADSEALRKRARAQVGENRDQEWHRTLARARHQAAEDVLAAATACGISAATPDEAVGLLERWEGERGQRSAQFDQARQVWARLIALLDGQALTVLQAAAADAQARAARASEGFTADELRSGQFADGVAEGRLDVDGRSAVLGSGGRLDEEGLRHLREIAQAAAAKADSAEGSLAERARGLPSVAEAEEELARAEEELARVQDLNATLDLTRRFMVGAQERAHRDIAPVLADSVRRRLPGLTGNRYTDVIVDPRTLNVQVCGPDRRWRPADRLSHGTAEQIYLLLRIALAGHLVKDKTTCPLLLDDVTVHADSQRMTQILELLVQASADRQIVLFTQQEQVRDWARTTLVAPRHYVHELSPVPTA
jgi:hypothetical protein